MEAESKLLPMKKARDFSKLQGLLCKEKRACDQEFARCIVSEQREAGCRESAPGMCAAASRRTDKIRVLSAV